MSDEIKKAIKRLGRDGGFDAPMERAIVISVDKNSVTCNVQLVSTDALINDVKIKPIATDGDNTQMGIILFPALGSYVIVGQINRDNIDVCVLSISIIESIVLDTNTALNLLISADGKLNLNAVQMVFNNGNNGGIPLVNPLTSIILKLQQQVNTLITTFNTHVHAVVGESTSPTVTPGPAPTVPLIKSTDISNQKITQ